MKRLLYNPLTVVCIALDPLHILCMTSIPTRHQASLKEIFPKNNYGVATPSRPQRFHLERETGLEPATFSLGS